MKAKIFLILIIVFLLGTLSLGIFKATRKQNKSCNHEFIWVTDVYATTEQTGLKHEECTKCGIKQNENTIIEILHYEFGEPSYTRNINNFTIDAIRYAIEDNSVFEKETVDFKVHYTKSKIEGNVYISYESDEFTNVAFTKQITEPYHTKSNFIFTEYNEGYSVKYNYTNPNIQKVMIPHTYEGKPVIHIEDNAFYNATNLKQIAIPNTIKSIGSNAFTNCQGLLSIIIPESVEEINSNAFTDTIHLVEVLNNSSQSFNKLFTNAISITRGKTSLIREYEGYNFITSNNVHYLINSINLPNGELNLPLNYEKQAYVIAKYAFYNTDITKVFINSNITKIDDYAFYNCPKLLNVEIVKDVKEIGNHVFYNCYNIVSITLPTSLTSIGDDAFTGCIKLIEIINKSNLELIKNDPKYGNIALNALVIKKNGESTIDIIDDFIFLNYQSNSYIVSYYGNDLEVTLPNHETEYIVYKHAFYNSNITKLNTNKAKVIDQFAFSGCVNLKEVTFTNNLKEIKEYAFSSCDLENIVIPNSVTSIGDGAFASNTSLTSCFIPNSVTYVGIAIFEGCNNATITIDFTEVPSSWHSEWNPEGLQVNYK